MPQINKEKPKDHNMWAVALESTRILINYAQKSPRTLLHTKAGTKVGASREGWTTRTMWQEDRIMYLQDT